MRRTQGRLARPREAGAGAAQAPLTCTTPGTALSAPRPAASTPNGPGSLYFHLSAGARVAATRAHLALAALVEPAREALLETARVGVSQEAPGWPGARPPSPPAARLTGCARAPPPSPDRLGADLTKQRMRRAPAGRAIRQPLLDRRSPRTARSDRRGHDADAPARARAPLLPLHAPSPRCGRSSWRFWRSCSRNAFQVSPPRACDELRVVVERMAR